MIETTKYNYLPFNDACRSVFARRQLIFQLSKLEPVIALRIEEEDVAKVLFVLTTTIQENPTVFEAYCNLAFS